jgi:hypothetical protein
MKLTKVQSPQEKPITVADMKIGDTFQVIHSQSICLLIDTKTVPVVNSVPKDVYVVWNFTSESSHPIDSYKEVIPLESEMRYWEKQ